jgi:TPR repeat protein
MYERGVGVLRDVQRAHQLYSQSAEQGYQPAQFALAKCYENGVGVQKDLDRAVVLFGRCAAAGNPRAQAEVERIEVRAPCQAPDADDRRQLHLKQAIAASEVRCEVTSP